MAPEDHLRAAIEHAQQALMGEPDDPTSATLAAALKQLYQVFATRQKEDEAAMGVTPAIKSLSRNSGGGAPPPGGAPAGPYG
jgi:hypothetical protein